MACSTSGRSSLRSWPGSLLDRLRRRRAAPVRRVGLRDGARRDVRRERALPPLPVQVGGAPRVGAAARPLDDLPLHRRHLHAVRAAGVQRHDHLGRPRDRVVRRGARPRAQLLLARRAEVGQRPRLRRGRLGRRDHDPADVLGRRRARLRARDGRRRALHRRRARLRVRTGRTRSRPRSGSTRSSTCSSSRPPRPSSSQSRSSSCNALPSRRTVRS